MAEEIVEVDPKSVATIPVSEIFARSAALLNDINKITYTDDVQLPYAKMAWERLRALLDSISSSIFKEVTIAMPYAANSDILFNPDDMFMPLTIYERPSGSTNDNEWVELTHREWEPIEVRNTAKIGYWAWRKQQLCVRPCTIDRDVKIRYIRNPPDLIDVSTQIFVGNALNYLSFKTAEFVARYVMRSIEKADSLGNDAAIEWDLMETNQIHGEQFKSVRRRPYRTMRSRTY